LNAALAAIGGEINGAAAAIVTRKPQNPAKIAFSSLANDPRLIFTYHFGMVSELARRSKL
jgi:hypothetical protein